MDLFSDSGAVFSDCRKYRYALWRFWDKSKPYVMFIGLNPSTANESKPDNTVTRVINFARDWGYGGVYMMNCFPYVSTDPEELRINGPSRKNDEWLKNIGKRCKQVIFAWGNFKIVTELNRDIELRNFFPDAKALVLNKNGSPKHPLYVAANTIPIPYPK